MWSNTDPHKTHPTQKRQLHFLEAILLNMDNQEHLPVEEEMKTEKEVVYQEAVTPLFRAIEETDWREALDIAESDPEQVKTWVCSRGTDNTSFAWSMWRRLPIHEACRRQAPVWFVSALFASFPESAYMATQFGELPLHLAVESGASPEVVNIIIVANWSAIVYQDQSGRDPTEILDRGDLLEIDDHRIVHESLMRCHKAYTDMVKAAEDEQAAIRKQHAEQLESLSGLHQEELEKERAIQEEVRAQVCALEAQIEKMKEVDNAKNKQIGGFDAEKAEWLAKTEDLQETIETCKGELAAERVEIDHLLAEIEEKEDMVANREETIDILSSDLKKLSAMHDHDLMRTVHDAEESMKAMVHSQVTLQNQLVRQSKALKTLLGARGISLPKVEQPHVQEEKASHPEDEGVDPGEAASALAAAAMAALQKQTV